MRRILELVCLVPVLGGCAATVAASPEAEPPKAAPRTAYVRALVVDVPPEAREDLETRDLCDVAGDPRVTVLEAPGIAATEGHDATFQAGPPTEPPAVRLSVSPRPEARASDRSRMIYDIGLEWGRAAFRFRETLASRETALRETQVPGSHGAPLLVLVRAVVLERDEMNDPAKARSALLDAFCNDPLNRGRTAARPGGERVGSARAGGQ